MARRRRTSRVIDERESIELRIMSTSMFEISSVTVVGARPPRRCMSSRKESGNSGVGRASSHSRSRAMARAGGVVAGSEEAPPASNAFWMRATCDGSGMVGARRSVMASSRDSVLIARRRKDTGASTTARYGGSASGSDGGGRSGASGDGATSGVDRVMDPRAASRSKLTPKTAETDAVALASVESSGSMHRSRACDHWPPTEGGSSLDSARWTRLPLGEMSSNAIGGALMGSADADGFDDRTSALDAAPAPARLVTRKSAPGRPKRRSAAAAASDASSAKKLNVCRVSTHKVCRMFLEEVSRPVGSYFACR
mmetsp:Transcript_3096/g.10148  ORF Transcript_3096/g.10148 Transcript_3096/m.10148 type:complete len:312 (-) Transcript_3096:1550-2485(-)